jgi:sugar lactone lactonase YvrE
MQKLRLFHFVCMFMIFSLIFPFLALQKETIRMIGASWTPGFFEIASDISANEEWIFLSDMNNSKIHVYTHDLAPLFDFGGYGTNQGNFIEIRGLCANNEKLFVASIDSFSAKTGRIQAFSKNGIFLNEFEKPKQRSDFLRITELKNKTLLAITERSLCLYSSEGKLLKEVFSIAGQSFLFLQDLVAVPDKGFAFIDRAKRGFFLVDPELKTIQQFGEEHLNIPISLDYHDKKYIIADANGDVHLFLQSGRYNKTIATSIYSNGIQAIAPNRLFITSALRRGISQLDLSTGKIQEIFIEAKNTQELHWPESIAINSKQDLYVSDDYLGGMKIFSLTDGAYQGQSAWLEDPKTPLKVISATSTHNQETIFVLSRTRLSSIYAFNGTQLQQVIMHDEKDQFCSIKCDSNGHIFALDCNVNSISKFSPEGEFLSKILLPKNEFSTKAFTINLKLFVLLSNGSLLVYPPDKSSPSQTLQLQSKAGLAFSEASSISSIDNTLLVSFRDKHLIIIYDLSNGEIINLFGSMGGPKTYASKENLQVDIGYQPGFFLFPSNMIWHQDNLYVSDAGNHRIQIIPDAHLQSDSTIIILTIGQKKAYINHKEYLLEAAPFISQQRTMVPLRFISEAFGAEVEWFPSERKILIQHESKTIELWIQKTLALIDQKEYILDAPPLIVNQRTFVPVRFISEALMAQVEWDAKDQIITIRRKN